MTYPYGITVTVLRRPKDARTGDPTGPAVPHDIPNCAFDPGGTTEINDLGERVTTRPTLYGPYDADIESDDQVIVPGDDRPWEVAGDIARWANPYTGDRPGSVIELARYRGG